MDVYHSLTILRAKLGRAQIFAYPPLSLSPPLRRHGSLGWISRWGRGVRGFSRKNLVAIALGVVLAGAPLLAFNYWLSGLIERQGQDEVGTSAKRAIMLAETRVSHVIAALDDLAARGVDSCRPANIESMRQT